MKFPSMVRAIPCFAAPLVLWALVEGCTSGSGQACLNPQPHPPWCRASQDTGNSQVPTPNSPGLGASADASASEFDASAADAPFAPPIVSGDGSASQSSTEAGAPRGGADGGESDGESRTAAPDGALDAGSVEDDGPGDVAPPDDVPTGIQGRPWEGTWHHQGYEGDP